MAAKEFNAPVPLGPQDQLANTCAVGRGNYLARYGWHGTDGAPPPARQEGRGPNS